MSAAECIARCECRGGLFITDKDILDVIGDPRVILRYVIRADGGVIVSEPHSFQAADLRDAVRWLIENKKVPAPTLCKSS
jgi:hypothetical protein